ncbi:MAG: CoA-binding protein [Candidatus Bathyarchaeota archaeon]
MNQQYSDNLVNEFLAKKIFAVVGASKNPEKYGHRIYKTLKEAGYSVYPVNPTANEILGDKCYPSLADLPEKPDVADLVVPPQIAMKAVEESEKLGIRYIWLQPGAESPQIVEFCAKKGIKCVHDLCVMIESIKRRNKQKP